MHSIIITQNNSLLFKDIRRILEISGYRSEYIEFHSKEIFNIKITKYNFFILDYIVFESFDSNDLAKHIRNIKGLEVTIIGISDVPWLFDQRVFNYTFNNTIDDSYKVTEVVNGIGKQQ